MGVGVTTWISPIGTSEPSKNAIICRPSSCSSLCLDMGADSFRAPGCFSPAGLGFLRSLNWDELGNPGKSRCIPRQAGIGLSRDGAERRAGCGEDVLSDSWDDEVHL